MTRRQQGSSLAVRWALGWLALLCAVMLLAGPARAAPSGEVRLVVDVSGSMKGNDPENLRANGIRLLVELLPTDIRAGLWTFGEQIANPLSLSAVDDRWRQRALDVLPNLTDYQQYTAIESALKAATQAPGHGPVHVILLTDGMVDIPAHGGDKQAHDRASRQRVLEQLAPALAKRGVIVDTIALSRNADTALLRSLSQQTGGLASVAENPGALLRSFLDVLGRAVPRQEVPLEQGHFNIDDQVDEFTALIFHDALKPSITLSAPDGRELTPESSGIRWRHDERFDLITVPTPAEGRWRINGPVGDDSRILIQSSLALNAPLPATLYQHFAVPLGAQLSDDDAAASDVGIDAELQQQGRVLARRALTRGANGHYRGQLNPGAASGNAELRLIAHGEDFTRLRRQSVDIAPAIAATLASDQSTIALSAAFDRLNRDNTAIEASLQGESLKVEPTGTQHWQVALPDHLPEESVPVELTARVRLDGEIRVIQLPPVRLNSNARVGLSGASLDRSAIDAQSMAPEQSDDEQQNTGWSLQRIWHEAVSRWPQVRHTLQEWGSRPWVWGIVALLVMLWLMSAMRRRRRRRRRRHRRHDPRL